MYASSSSYARSASTMNSVASSAIWIIVSLVLAIVGGIVLYFTFLKKDNEGKYTGFLGWMYDCTRNTQVALVAFLFQVAHPHMFGYIIQHLREHDTPVKRTLHIAHKL